MELIFERYYYNYVAKLTAFMPTESAIYLKLRAFLESTLLLILYLNATHKSQNFSNYPCTCVELLCSIKVNNFFN